MRFHKRESTHMKPKMSFAWFMATLGMAALLLVKWQTVREQRAEIGLLESELADYDGQRKSAGTRLLALERENLSLRHELLNARLDLEKAGETASQPNTGGVAKPAKPPTRGPSDQSGGNPMEMFGKMFEDPDMRALMAETQQQALKQLYEPLFKKLNLNPGERKAFSDLLAAQATNALSRAGSMMAGGLGSQEASQAATSMAEEQKDLEQKIAELIGPERAGQYKDYTLTMGDRAMLTPYFTSSGMSPDQSEALLSIFAEERKAVAGGTPLDLANPASLADPAWVERTLQSQEQIYQRVLDRSQEMLSHEQYEALGSFQTNMMNQQRLGLKMAEKLMGKNPPTTEQPRAQP